MQINVKMLEQITLVELAGDVDASTAPSVQDKVLPLVLSSNSKILLDMIKVPYMSSAGLRMLLSLFRQVTAKDGKLILVGLSEEISETMSITGFLDFFKTCETVEAGIEALNQ